MTLAEEILTLKAVVSSLVDRVSQLEAENALLSQGNSILRAETLELRAENVESKSRLSKNATNSHKPPSSEGYSKKPAFAKVRGGQVGGQKGHQGKTLSMVCNADQSVKCYAQICS